MDPRGLCVLCLGILLFTWRFVRLQHWCCLIKNNHFKLDREATFFVSMLLESPHPPPPSAMH